MSKITVIQVSDIHFDGNEPENQGLVLNAFFKDLETNTNSDKENTYCIISGDLVNKGNSQRTYNELYCNFVEKLLPFVPLNHIICVPGNHDLNRNVVETNFNKHDEIISNEYKESDLNEFIKNDKKNNDEDAENEKNIDEEDCSILLGYFCEYLLREGKESFSEKDFLITLTPFKEQHYIDANISDILQILKHRNKNGF